MGIFPFGKPVTSRPPSADGRRPVFVLGAYPSTLHVRWYPPPESRLRPLQALAVDDEPEPFWTGTDANERIEAWRAERAWQPAWGNVSQPVPQQLNGSAGLWVSDNVLAPLGVAQPEAWISDCLDTYRASTAMKAAIASAYAPFARAVGLPQAAVLDHPSEVQIVAEASRSHQRRLSTELATCQPDVIITLGNAALRVLRQHLGDPPPIRKLSAGDRYGESLDVQVGHRNCSWLPLAHPGAPAAYQSAHQRWQARRGRASENRVR